MKLIIDIPEDIYKEWKLEGKYCHHSYAQRLILNGAPIDLDGLKSDMKALNCGYPYGLDYLLDCLDKRLGITIAEADKG